ncbi:hypothetical protein SCB71_06405 [Herbiconiux sp. KACC 21604]|uniref:hypothetical protein n=1 Tax=unclassified Herbiconiux TaxID=2618217 RepID=UPI001492540B|nr:hypothetical protein [Herbiconiux sp. SALV-R1]QJU52948.1 hypothetical protein HL652_04390 [Herbiconiux sp. SALV-R1]WPO87870.1 hypothetical protein SCB71_06405 [Herbiconiux sp. KACC 21604]
MQIMETVQRPLVGVEPNDEYGVDLILGKKRVSLSLADAKRVREWIAEVEMQQTMSLNQDMRDRADRMLAQPNGAWEVDQ